MHFGHTIKSAREAMHLTQDDLAKRIDPNLTQQAVQRWETLEAPPLRSLYLYKICDVLGIPLPPPEAAPRIRRQRSAYVGEAAPQLGAALTPTELIRVIREKLPEHLKSFAGGRISTKHLGIVFPYASKRVIAHAMYGTPNGASRLKLRSAAWRMMVAMLGTNDFPPSGTHYLLAALELPEGNGTNALPAPMREEGLATGLLIEEHHDLDQFVARIVELENTPTERDLLFQDFSQENFEDLL